MSDNNNATKGNMQKAFVITGTVTMISLALGYLFYSKFYKDQSNDMGTDSSGEDYILDKSFKKTSRNNRKG